MMLLSISFVSAACETIDDAKVYISACPSTITQSGYVDVNFTVKAASLDVDFAFGINNTNAQMINAQLWKNVTDINGTTKPTWVSYNLSSINYTYDDKTTWSYARNLAVVANKTYFVKFYVFVNTNTYGKYDIAVKPSAQTFAQAIAAGNFYLLDPWWNSTTNTDYNQTYWQLINNGSSTVSINSDGTLTLNYMLPYKGTETGLWSLFHFDSGSITNVAGTPSGTIVLTASTTYNTTGKYKDGRNNTAGNTDLLKYVMTAGGDEFFGPAPRTTEMWAKVTSSSTATSITNWYPYLGGAKNGFQLHTTSAGRLQWESSGNNAAGDGVDCNYTVSSQTWFHVAIGQNATGTYCYVNGVLTNFTTVTTWTAGSNITGSTSRDSDNAVLGDGAFGDSGTATIDELAVFNYSKSSWDFNTYNPAQNMFYSKMNDSVAGNYTYIVLNLSASDANVAARYSLNNGLNWTEWYNNTKNGIILTAPVPGNQKMFQVNITGNTTYSPIVYGVGMTNSTQYNTTGFLQFFTKDLNGIFVETMRLLGAKLGIGTSTPTQELDVRGSVNISNKLYLVGISGTGKYLCINSTDNSVYRNTTCS